MDSLFDRQLTLVLEALEPGWLPEVTTGKRRPRMPKPEEKQKIPTFDELRAKGEKAPLSIAAAMKIIEKAVSNYQLRTNPKIQDALNQIADITEREIENAVQG